MQGILRRMMRPAVLGALTLGTALAQSPPPTPDPPRAEGSSGQLQEREQQPVEQQDTVHPKNSRDDVEAIGNRKVGKGPNFYSLEKEIALGKQLAQEVGESHRCTELFRQDWRRLGAVIYELPDWTPQLRGIKKEIVTYKRHDGAMNTPSNRRFATILWAFWVMLPDAS